MDPGFRDGGREGGLGSGGGGSGKVVHMGVSVDAQSYISSRL